MCFHSSYNAAPHMLPLLSRCCSSCYSFQVIVHVLLLITSLLLCHSFALLLQCYSFGIAPHALFFTHYNFCIVLHVLFLVCYSFNATRHELSLLSYSCNSFSCVKAPLPQSLLSKYFFQVLVNLMLVALLMSLLLLLSHCSSILLG
jgi:hypothetical protein